MSVASDFESHPEGQLVLARDLRMRGVSDSSRRAAVRSGALIRIHRGVYVLGAGWRELPPEVRYRMRVRAAALMNPRQLTFCHESAAAMHDLPLITPWPDTVHIATPGAVGGSSQPWITAHTRPNAGESVVLDGLRVTSLPRTVIDLAAQGPFVNAVAIIDAVLRRHGEAYRQRLLAELAAAALRRGVAGARGAIEFGDSRSDSAGESLSRARIHELGFTIPELQVTIETVGHRYVVDFFWPGANVVGEFDGRAKYSRGEYAAGLSPEEIVWREKKREDAIRAATGARVVRWTWAEAMDPTSLARLLEHAGVPRAGATRHERRAAALAAIRRTG